MDKSLIHRKSSYVTKLSDADYFVNRNLRTVLYKYISEYIKNGMSVADIGCGEQPLRAFIEQQGAAYTGIDITQNAHGTVAVIASISAIPLSSSVFDCIVCTEVLEHVNDAKLAFAEISRLLKPGGICILTTPFLYPLHEEPHDYQRILPYAIKYYAHLHNQTLLRLETTGNETEVAATIVNHFFLSHDSNYLTKVMFALCRASTNCFTIIFNRLFMTKRSVKGYLNTIAVLCKEI